LLSVGVGVGVHDLRARPFCGAVTIAAPT
jgi:hypothetical protein